MESAVVRYLRTGLYMHDTCDVSEIQEVNATTKSQNLKQLSVHKTFTAFIMRRESSALSWVIYFTGILL